ncbi:MAG: hypothetical protein HY789_06285 [Deltaproteobacteria bacterium]|nr:hypothetical protein [Deltaproteobacteria bacterium]
MVIFPGIPLSQETQVGFFGSPEDVCQQLREQEEGYPACLRWFLIEQEKIEQTQQTQTCILCMKKKAVLSWLRETKFFNHS